MTDFTARARRLERERLAVVAPDPAVGAALAWAVRVLAAWGSSLRGAAPISARGPGPAGSPAPPASGVPDTAGGPPAGDPAAPAGDPAAARLPAPDLARIALAALACGDAEAAADAVRLLARRDPADADGAAAAHYLLLLARYAAWTGDVALPAAGWERARAIATSCMTHGSAGFSPGDAAVRTAAGPVPGRASGTRDRDNDILAAALREFAALAEDVGDSAFAAELRRRGPPAPEAGAPGARADEDSRSDAAILRFLASPRDAAAGAEGAGPAPAPAAGPAHPREAGPAPTPAASPTPAPAAGPVRDAAADPAGSTAAAADAVEAVVHGLLGAEPDAARGRLRLRPRIPAAWDRFEARNLRVGGAEVRLEYRREGRRHTFRVEQTGGSVPLRLVFEPAVPGASLAAARVDGRPAHPDATARGGRVVVPLQVVLDHERTIELEADEAADAAGS